MGREIIFEVREDDKTIWPKPGDDLFVCGRDTATTQMASTILHSKPEGEEILYLTCKEYNIYLEIKEMLKEYYDKDMKEIQKAKDALEDLREARRHTATLKDFEDFSDTMDATEEWIKDNDWSRAGAMIEYLDECYNKMLDIVNSDDNEDRDYVINKYRVAIILSE